MAKILTLANQKGGVGKSALAINLTYVFKSIKVGLVDSDLQGSLTSLNIMADGINLIDHNDTFTKLKDLDYDLIIIDTPPYLSNNLIPIFNSSDLIIVPTKPGFFDIMAIQGTLKLIEQSKLTNSKLKARILFNMVKHNSSITKEIKKIVGGFEIPVFRTQITDRVSYTRSVIQGGIMNTSDNNAKKEIISLCEEIMNLLNE